MEGLHEAVTPPFLLKRLSLMEGLHETVPPFLLKTFEMVDDLSTADIVYWNRGGHSFVVWDHNAFSTTVLPTYFKHNNFSSFVRQLNTYGFRKIDAEKWEFANEAFVRGQKHLLKNIRRRRGPTHPFLSLDPTLVGPCVELSQFGQEAEVNRLKRDKQILTMEFIKLRQQNQNTKLHLQQVESRVRGTEKKQKQVMRFLVNATQNPDFIRQLVQHKEKKEQSRPVEDGETHRKDKGLNPVEVGHDGFEVSELEALALQMQGLQKVRNEGKVSELEALAQALVLEMQGLQKTRDEGKVSELEALALGLQKARNEGKVLEVEALALEMQEMQGLQALQMQGLQKARDEGKVSELEALALEMQGLQKARDEGNVSELEALALEMQGLQKASDEGKVSELEALALEMQGLQKARDEGKVLELEGLALEMQGLRKVVPRDKGVEVEELGHLDKEVLDEGFWEELLNQGFNNEAERLMLKNEEGEEKDHHVSMLANRFWFLGSTSGSNIS